MKAIKSLNRNKAADYFGVTAENVIYGGKALCNYLRQLLDISFKTCYIPDILKIGTLFPVFKNKGDKTEANKLQRNYCQSNLIKNY